MLAAIESAGTVIFPVRVVPRASRTEIAGEHDGAVRIRIAAPPVDGAANDELIRFLSRLLGVPRSAVTIESGGASRSKRVSVAGIGTDAVRSILSAKS